MPSELLFSSSNSAFVILYASASFFFSLAKIFKIKFYKVLYYEHHIYLLDFSFSSSSLFFLKSGSCSFGSKPKKTNKEQIITPVLPFPAFQCTAMALLPLGLVERYREASMSNSNIDWNLCGSWSRQGNSQMQLVTSLDR